MASGHKHGEAPAEQRRGGKPSVVRQAHIYYELSSHTEILLYDNADEPGELYVVIVHDDEGIAKLTVAEWRELVASINRDIEHAREQRND